MSENPILTAVQSLPGAMLDGRWPANARLSQVGAFFRVDGEKVCGPVRDKVALVGFMEKHRHLVPYDDPEWEVWGFNMGNRIGFMHDSAGYFRADRWFDLHPLSVQDEKDMAWIQTCPIPLYLTEPYLQNRQCLVYPLQMIEEYFRVNYWACSFAYAMALAIYEGFQTIGLYGCDLDWGRERAVEQGNLNYWIGLAHGMGRTVVIPPDSALLKHPARYGFDYHEEKRGVEVRLAKLMDELSRNGGVMNEYLVLIEARRNECQAQTEMREKQRQEGAHAAPAE